VEFETERVDSGDGVWAQSGIVGYVLFTPLVWDEGFRNFRTPENADYTHGITACLCCWKAEELEKLDDAATKAAGEGDRP